MNIERIKAREQKATPGPWNRIEHKHGRIYVGTNEKPIADICNLYHTESEANLAFIAHARTDIPELIAEVERLTGKVRYVDNKYQHYRRLSEKAEQQIATLKKALEIASAESNKLFNQLELFGLTKADRKASCIQDNVDVWIQQAKEADHV